jgi:hypothetical protein
MLGRVLAPYGNSNSARTFSGGTWTRRVFRRPYLESKQFVLVVPIQGNRDSSCQHYCREIDRLSSAKYPPNYLWREESQGHQRAHKTIADSVPLPDFLKRMDAPFCQL